MDEYFSVFLKAFKGPVDRQEVPSSSIKRYIGRLPDKLLEYWAEHGWCGYGNGIFWIVNPEEYEGVVASWLEGTPFGDRDTYHLIARSAFGDLYLWGEQTGQSLQIISTLSRCVISHHEILPGQMDNELQRFILSRNFESSDFEDLFTLARKKLGTLKHDELYGFVPALMLGGSEELGNLEKVKAVEHLILLSQLADLEPFDF